ncbi:inositol 1,4,5-trisphosphate receptor-interacting protein-like 1 [Larus michahellis]|uniref:inositol 1,4,5-trisphosphate receptor-interacting protein-like 1 n=1 Tax=Larus michahellis TaxID=119627 RepID=UPI003D9AC77D
MREREQQREEHLSQRMTRVLQELELGVLAWGARLFAALQQWQFWATAALLVLLFGLCCWLRRWSHQPGSSSKEGTSRDMADKEEKTEDRPSVALDAHTILAKRLLDLSESFTMVKELVDEVLRVCQKLSRNSFMPRLMPVIGVGSTLRGWSPCEQDATYRLLVPLKPPHGHAFHLEMATATEEMLARKSSLRVELQCTCMREPLAEDMLCFLLHPQEELRQKQGPSPLRTLCTGPYLDTERTARWLQIVVKHAWALMAPSTNCRPAVLPARHSCKLQLTLASHSTVLIEMTFGVKQGDSYAFLSWE